MSGDQGTDGLTMYESISDDDFLNSLLGDFIDESDEILLQLNENLLKLDDWVKSLGGAPKEPCDSLLLNEMFRAAHSLKGLSAMLRLDDLNLLTHVMENVFEAARNEQLYISSDIVDLVFRGVDLVGAMIKSLKKSGSIIGVDPAEVISEIQDLLKAHNIENYQATPPTLNRSAGDARETTHGADCPQLLSDIEDDLEFQSDYEAIFIDESLATLSELSALIVADRTERNVEDAIILSHRIKGSASAEGRNRFARFAHWMETAIGRLSECSDEQEQSICEAVTAGIETLRRYIEAMRVGSDEDVDLEDPCQAIYLSAQLGEALDHVEVVAPQASTSLPVCTGALGALVESRTKAPQHFDIDRVADVLGMAPAEGNAWLVYLRIEHSPGYRASQLGNQVERAKQLGPVFFTDERKDQTYDQNEFSEIAIGIASAHSIDQINYHFGVDPVSTVMLFPLRTVSSESAQAIPELSGAPRPSRGASRVRELSSSPADPLNVKPTETLRVDLDRLDRLINLAGQLAINKARFVQINDQLRPLARSKYLAQVVQDALLRLERVEEDLCQGNQDAIDRARIARSQNNVAQLRSDLERVQHHMADFSQSYGHIRDLGEAVNQLDRVSEGIQKSVMDTRMVPIGPVFNRFKRVVRDIVRGTNKDVRLEILGEHTELDKCMIDKIGDPLIHMVRNSVDHAIETKEERTVAGKTAHGTLTLNAFHRGNRVVIQVDDDGKGMNPETILSKAIENGIVTASDGEKLTPAQICQLIWEPGLSTADRITEISGRGMGMDIVRSKIEELHGTIDVESHAGKGTCFTIRLPLTMAILPSLLVQIDGIVYAIPADSVNEIIRVSAGELASIGGRRTAALRDRMVPIFALADVFEWSCVMPPEPYDDDEELTVVVIESDEQEAGLVVQGLIGEQDIVIKSLAENYRNVTGLAGASILGDGCVSLILDVGALIEMSSDSSFAPAIPLDAFAYDDQ